MIGRRFSRAARAQRQAERAVQDKRLAAVDRELDQDLRESREACMARHPSQASAAVEPRARPHDPTVLAGCGCGSCVEAAQAVIDYWKERGRAERALRDAVTGARFERQLNDDDRAFLADAGVSL